MTNFDPIFGNDCNLSDYDSWCYTHQSHECWEKQTVTLESGLVVPAKAASALAFKKALDAEMQAMLYGPSPTMFVSQKMYDNFKAAIDKHVQAHKVWVDEHDPMHSDDFEATLISYGELKTTDKPAQGKLTPVSTSQEELASIYAEELKQMFPGTVEVEPPPKVTQYIEAGDIIIQEATEPPELTGLMLDAITIWMETEYWSFHTPTEYWTYQINVHKTILTDASVDPAEHEVTPPYYTVLINRVPIVLTDRRWWVEIAVRADTGEPVVTVNHQGSYEEYRQAMIEKGQKK